MIGHYHISKLFPERKWWQFWRSKPMLVQGVLKSSQDLFKIKSENDCPLSRHYYTEDPVNNYRSACAICGAWEEENK